MQPDNTNSLVPDANLRQVLKRETQNSHDRLDAVMGGWPVGSSEGYTQFLLTQYRSRAPIERWVARTLPAEGAPPEQAPLIARDLGELGIPLPPTVDFTLPDHADAIGLVWALAGSSLGNRTMLRQRQKIGAAGPEHFLADTAMTEFFTRLRARIEQPASDASALRAVAGAEAVFTAFIAALPDETVPAAA